MNQNVVFYITNHGYGHASRNVAIIRHILNKNKCVRVWIKTDSERTAFIKRNFPEEHSRLFYDDKYSDIGLFLKKTSWEIDTDRLYQSVSDELQKWDAYISAEADFLIREKIDIMVVDVIPWALLAAKRAGIYSVLLCNFTWYEMYRDYLPTELIQPYYNAYSSASKVFLYTFGNLDILNLYKNAELISLVSREANALEVKRIYEHYSHPLVFVSVGRSITLSETYDVSYINATFLTTVGVHLSGNNVVPLPAGIINTQDYIAASDYVVSKSGWSTLAEIFLNKKQAAVIARCDNPEDNAVMSQIQKYNCGIECTFADLKHMDVILEKLSRIAQFLPNGFHNDAEKLADYILKSRGADSDYLLPSEKQHYQMC